MKTNEITHHDDPTSTSTTTTGTTSTGTTSTGSGTWFTGPCDGACDEAPARNWTKGRIRVARATAAVAAAGAALAVWTVAVPLAGATLAVRLNGAVQQVGPGAVAGTALLAGLAGWLLLAGLERFGRRPRRTWAITAGLLMSASLAGPLHSGVGGGAAAALAAMHLAVGVVLISVLPRTARC